MFAKVIYLVRKEQYGVLERKKTSKLHTLSCGWQLISKPIEQHSQISQCCVFGSPRWQSQLCQRPLAIQEKNNTAIIYFLLSIASILLSTILIAGVIMRWCFLKTWLMLGNYLNFVFNFSISFIGIFTSRIKTADWTGDSLHNHTDPKETNILLKMQSVIFGH